MAGICVFAYAASSDILAVTATNGTYTVTGLVPGNYTVEFMSGCGSGSYLDQWYDGTAAGAPSSSGAVAIATTVASPASGINAALVAGTSISGRVTAAVGGAPLAGICVSASTVDGVSNGVVFSAADGTYSITGLVAGSYVVSFVCGLGKYDDQWYDGTAAGATSRSGAVLVATTVASPAMGINAALVTGASITVTTSVSGKVTAAVGGAPLAGICVIAISIGGSGLATTGADGTYTITGLVAGSYNVVVDPTCTGAVTSSYAIAHSSTPLVVGSGSTVSGENFALVESGTIADVITPSSAAPSNAVVGGPTYTPSATATSGDVVAVTLDTSSSGCTLNGGVISFVASGTCKVDFNDPSSGPNDAYAAATQVQQSFGVAPASSGGNGGGGASGGGNGGAGGSGGAPTIAPPPSGLPTSDFGPPNSVTTSSTLTTTVTQNAGGSSITVSVPAGALPSSTTLSVYPLTNISDLAASVPAGKSYVLSFAVSWVTPSNTSPRSSTPLTVTITNPNIKAGDTIYELTSTGIVAVGTASVDGSARLTFSSDPVFILSGNNLKRQARLRLTTLRGMVGRPLALRVRGGSGPGAVTFKVTNGSAKGCVVLGSSLRSSTAGTCVVTATKSASSTYIVASSSRAVTMAIPARPAPAKVRFRANSYSLSGGAQKTLRVLSQKLLPGAAVVITGYAHDNRPLAKRRAVEAFHYLATRVRIHVELKWVTRTSMDETEVVTTKQ